MQSLYGLEILKTFLQIVLAIPAIFAVIQGKELVVKIDANEASNIKTSVTNDKADIYEKSGNNEELLEEIIRKFKNDPRTPSFNGDELKRRIKHANQDELERKNEDVNKDELKRKIEDINNTDPNILKKEINNYIGTTMLK